MNPSLEKYLAAVDRYLKPLPTSERIDIIKEIQSSMIEMERENLSPEQILERLGNPRELAKAYLGDLLANGKGFGWNRFLILCAFYSAVGFSGLLVIPTLTIVAPVFIFCGILTPLLGIVKLIDSLLNLNLPFAQQIGFTFGTVILNPVPVFLASLITGAILFLLGIGSWKLLLLYCRKIGKTKRDLSI